MSLSSPADWTPTAGFERLQAAAAIRARIRRFFEARGVLEVETPMLSSAGLPDPHIESFRTRYSGPALARDTELYLHTSPEFPMKRLLAAGSGPIYQLCRVFRQGEAGRLHNPEFTLLEWYRPGWDHLALMAEVEALVGAVAGEAAEAWLPATRITYWEAFCTYAGIDPYRASISQIRHRLEEEGVEVAGAGPVERQDWLDLALTRLVEPALGAERFTFLHDYPPEQAALARVRPARGAEPAVAERFELYWRGVELANGFHELADAKEQRRRFDADNEARRALGLAEVPADGRLLSALEKGLPDCSGVALGVDRLVMLATGASNLSEVLAFPIDRA